MTNLDSILNSRDITLPAKVHLVKAVVFPVVMYGCEIWTIKKAEHWRIDAFALVLEKTLESSWVCKEIQPVHPKGNQSWMFIGRIDAEAEALIVWPLDVKNWLTGKDPDAGKYWRQEKGMIEDEMVEWHHQRYGHEFEYNSGVGDGQGSLACFSPWCHKESDRTEWLNWLISLHSFPSKEQASFNFIVAVPICSDFGAQENKMCHYFHFILFYLPYSDGTKCHYISFLNVGF